MPTQVLHIDKLQLEVFPPSSSSQPWQVPTDQAVAFIVGYHTVKYCFGTASRYLGGYLIDATVIQWHGMLPQHSYVTCILMVFCNYLLHTYTSLFETHRARQSSLTHQVTTACHCSVFNCKHCTGLLNKPQDSVLHSKSTTAMKLQGPAGLMAAN